MRTALVLAAALSVIGSSAWAGESVDPTLRQAHQNEIDYYIQRYDGSDVTLAKFNCVKPVIPARSETSKDIKAVGTGIDDWMACYNNYVADLQDKLPAGKAIPDVVVDLMTDAELQQAVGRMARAYAAVHADARAQAEQLLAARDAWQAKTNEFVLTQNASTQQVMILEQQALANKKSTIITGRMNVSGGGTGSAK